MEDLAIHRPLFIGELKVPVLPCSRKAVQSSHHVGGRDESRVY